VSNYRNGISVISVDGLLLDNVVMSYTRGHAPQCGIDFEPNNPKQRLNNIKLKNCIVKNNAYHGYDIHLTRFNHNSMPVDIVLDNCKAYGNTFYNLVLTFNSAKKVAGKPVRGKIDFNNCTFSGNKRRQ